jgi:hypothetical protein
MDNIRIQAYEMIRVEKNGKVDKYNERAYNYDGNQLQIVENVDGDLHMIKYDNEDLYDILHMGSPRFKSRKISNKKISKTTKSDLSRKKQKKRTAKKTNKKPSKKSGKKIGKKSIKKITQKQNKQKKKK